VEQVVSGLDVPWSIAFLPNGDMLVTERRWVGWYGMGTATGSGRHCSVTASGEGGLLGTHPNVASNRLSTSTTQRQERIASEPGGALEAFFGRR